MLIVFDVAVNLMMDALADRAIGILTGIRIDVLVDVNPFAGLKTTFGFANVWMTVMKFRFRAGFDF